MADFPSENMNLPPFPKEFRELLVPLIRELVVERPPDIATFCAQYFERLLEERQTAEKEIGKECGEKAEIPAAAPGGTDKKPDGPDLETGHQHGLPPTKSTAQGSASAPTLSDDGHRVRDGKELRVSSSCHETGQSAPKPARRRKVVSFNLEPSVQEVPARGSACCVDMYDCIEAETTSTFSLGIDEPHESTERDEDYDDPFYEMLRRRQWTHETPNAYESRDADLVTSGTTQDNLSGDSAFSDYNGYQDDYEDYEASAPPYENEEQELVTLLDMTHREAADSPEYWDNEMLKLGSVFKTPQQQATPPQHEDTGQDSKVSGDTGQDSKVSEAEGNSGGLPGPRKKWTLSEEDLRVELMSQSPEEASEELSDSLEDHSDEETVGVKVQPLVSYEFVPHLDLRAEENDCVVDQSAVGLSILCGDSDAGHHQGFAGVESRDQEPNPRVFDAEAELHLLIDSLAGVLENIASGCNVAAEPYLIRECGTIRECEDDVEADSQPENSDDQIDAARRRVSLEDYLKDYDEESANGVSPDVEYLGTYRAGELIKNGKLDSKNWASSVKVTNVDEVTSRSDESKIFVIPTGDSTRKDNGFRNLQAESSDASTSDRGYINEGFWNGEDENPSRLDLNNRRGANLLRGRRREMSLFENLPARRPHRRSRVHPASRNYSMRDRGDVPFPHIDETPEITGEEEEAAVETPRASEVDEWREDADFNFQLEDSVREVLDSMMRTRSTASQTSDDVPVLHSLDENVLNHMRLHLSESQRDAEDDSEDKSQGESQKDSQPEEARPAEADSKEDLVPMSEGDGIQVQLGGGVEFGPCPCPNEDVLPPAEDVILGVIGDGNQDGRMICPTRDVSTETAGTLELNSAGGDREPRPESQQADRNDRKASPEAGGSVDHRQDAQQAGDHRPDNSLDDGNEDCPRDVQQAGDHRTENQQAEECENCQQEIQQAGDRISDNQQAEEGEDRQQDAQRSGDNGLENQENDGNEGIWRVFPLVELKGNVDAEPPCYEECTLCVEDEGIVLDMPEKDSYLMDDSDDGIDESSDDTHDESVGNKG